MHAHTHTHTSCDSYLRLMATTAVATQDKAISLPSITCHGLSPRVLSPGTPTICVSQSSSVPVLLMLTDLDDRCSLVSSHLPMFEVKASPQSHS